MTRRETTLASRLTDFSSCYLAARRIWDRDFVGNGEYSTLLRRPLSALKWLSEYFYQRTGANPAYAIFHRKALDRCLGKRPGTLVAEQEFKRRVLGDRKLPEAVWKKFVDLCPPRRNGRGKAMNKSNNYGPVSGTLRLLCREGEANLIVLLSHQKLTEARRTLEDLKGVGPKLSRFILRDLRELFGYWETTEDVDLACFQPVDMWVSRWSELCWRDRMPKSDYSTSQSRWAEEVTLACISEKLNPSHYNMGAWFCGSHKENILDFFDEDDMTLEEYADFVENLSREKIRRITKGIEEYHKARDRLFYV